MCVVSMVGDHYSDKWEGLKYWPLGTNYSVYDGPTRVEFNTLKKEVEEMKILLKKAMEYDKKNNEPACEMEEKVAVLKKIAALVGVDLSEIFGNQ